MADAANKTKREKSPLTKVLPTDRLAFEKQAEVLRGFAAVHESNGGQSVTNEEVGAILTPAISGGTVIQTNAFFADVGLLIRPDEGGFKPCPELVEYHKACQWNESEAKGRLRPLFERTWFYRLLVPRLQLSAQEDAACLAILAQESGATKDYETRLRYLLNFLSLAGVISINGTTVSLAIQNRNGHGNDGRKDHTPIVQPPRTTPSDTAVECHTYVLPLDRENKRTVSITAPLDINRNEINRLKKWLEVTLLVEWTEGDGARIE